MFEFVLTPAERALLQALDSLGVHYLVVGMAAALLEGAPGTTQDLDLWFGDIDETRLSEAAHRERLDLVVTAHGLDSFEEEYLRARECDLDGLRVKVLPLERVIASKRSARRPKDLAQIPLLEATLAARRATGADS